MAVFSQETGAAAGGSAAPPRPATGFPSNFGSAGRPRRRQSVGATSKTLAFPRSFDGDDRRPLGGEDPRVAVPEERRVELDAGVERRAVGSPLEAVVGDEDERRPVASRLGPELPEDSVALDVDRLDGVLELPELLVPHLRELRRDEAARHVADLVGPLEVDHREVGALAVVEVERDLRVDARGGEDLPVARDRVVEVVAGQTAASNSARETRSAFPTSSYGGSHSRFRTIRTPSASPSGHVRACDFTRRRGSKRTGAARSETRKPFTFSAGQVAQKPTTPTLSPFALARFQMAGTFRERPEIGRRVRVFGSSSWKSATPWSIGVRPVTIVFQTRGRPSAGSSRGPRSVPFATRAERFGRRPSFIRRSRRRPVGSVPPDEDDLRPRRPAGRLLRLGLEGEAGARRRTRAATAGKRGRRRDMRPG